MAQDTTTSRVLRLLSLLQAHQFWPGPVLASRLGISERTLRRDIDRLRDLDYRVRAVRGVAGGYQLERGAELPPMIFTADEAVALALALQGAVASTSLAAAAELTVAALAKLDQVLPSHVRGRVAALQASAVSTTPIRDDALVDADLLGRLALACRDSELLRFRYTSADGDESVRRVEPAGLVQHARRWYLAAWDVEREDWRTFRVDRIHALAPTARRVPPRSLPPGATVADLVTGGVERAVARATFAATIRIAAPLAEVEEYLGDYTSGLSADGDEHTTWIIRSDRLEVLAGALAWLVWDFEVRDGAELRAHLAAFAARIAAS